MQSFSRLYTHRSGIPVNVCIFSYDEIYEAFNSLQSSSNYDVIRLDVTWLSWFSEKLLMPLTQIDADISGCLSDFLEGTPENYAIVHGDIYTLPSTPSVQMLFYRKDLFESPIYKRMYFEQFKTELRPPQTFAEFNRIAAFFTKRLNPASPVDYGATVTLGSTGVAGSEYLARLFARQENLFNEKREIRLDSQTALDSLRELIELKRFTAPDYCFLVGQYGPGLCLGQLRHVHSVQQLCQRPFGPRLPGCGKHRLCHGPRLQSLNRRRKPGRVPILRSARLCIILHQMDVQRAHLLRGRPFGQHLPLPADVRKLRGGQ